MQSAHQDLCLLTRRGHGRRAAYALVICNLGPRARRCGHVDKVSKDGQSFADDWHDMETFSFGDSPELADMLLELVLAGTKRATCCAESQGLLSAEIGKMMVVVNGQGVPKAILKMVELTKRRFDQVDEAFAYDEGEGDRSLQHWRETHERYFARLGRYAPDMMLWCERFHLVERIGDAQTIE